MCLLGLRVYARSEVLWSLDKADACKVFRYEYENGKQKKQEQLN